MKHRKYLRIVSATIIIICSGLGNAWANDKGSCEKLYQARQYERAFPVCRKAAAQGYADAQFKLGVMYYYNEGEGVKQDIEAVKWFRKAAAQGDAGAQFKLGAMYEKGDGVKQDYTEALKWYRKAADSGNINAEFYQFRLGEMYYNGQGVKQDYAEAAQWYRKAADQGETLAQFALGSMYYNGQGVKQDYAEAAQWARKAAKQGNAGAQLMLGLMYYYNGHGVKQNYAEAKKWYRKAAVQGNADAQYMLGAMYFMGKGVKQDYTEALKWYRKAAVQGNADAQYMLGAMYYEGKGVKQDYVEAVKWARKAAAQGDADAQILLSEMYYNGQGVKQDYAEAAQWYRKAAEQGNAGAQFNLGVMYANGQGVMQSDTAAADWYYKAGLNYLKAGNRDKALTSAGRIKKLGNIPNAFLADKLLAQVYGGSVAKQVSPKHKKKKATSIVSGTGWLVSGGYVVTNNHVVAGRKSIVLLRRDGVEIPATIIATDTANDLALLKPDSNKSLPRALPLANRPARVGEHVFTIGYPHPDMMGKEAKLTDGIINARTGLGNDPRVYQISVPLQGGNSGGPLLNMKGEVVGVAASKMSAVKVFKWTGDLPQNVNYAVKVGYVRVLLSSVDTNANVRELPSRKDSLAELANRIEGSVLMIIAE